jgi:hypothetical protein
VKPIEVALEVALVDIVPRSMQELDQCKTLSLEANRYFGNLLGRESPAMADPNCAFRGEMTKVGLGLTRKKRS